MSHSPSSSRPKRRARAFAGRRALALLALALGLGACGSGGSPSSSPGEDRDPGDLGGENPNSLPLTINVTDRVIRRNTRRLSINVGKNDPFGAAHLLKNRIPNPGFEAGLFSSVWHVGAGATSGRIPMAEWNALNTNDALAIGWPDGFWRGGTYEVLTGPAAGTIGRVQEFFIEGTENVFYLDPMGILPQPGDAIATTVDRPGLFRAANFPYAHPDPTQRRPGSRGRQCLALDYAGPGIASWTQGLDTGWGGPQRSATKLVSMEGSWRLAFWARSENDTGTLTVRLKRAQENTFVNETLNLTSTWEYHTIDFQVGGGQDPVGPYTLTETHPGLLLEFFVGSVSFLDDLYLARTDETNPTAFTDAFVERLKELRPTVLRYLSRQFGGDLDNQLARPGGRRTQGSHPARRDPQHWDYSLHEFLELCLEVGADPWYCVPTSWSSADWVGLLDYLAAPAVPSHPYAMLRAGLGRREPWTEAFGQIHLEFGNEAWGSADKDDPFWGISLDGGARLAQAADRRFALLRSRPEFDPARFDLVIGGQFRNATTQRLIEQNSNNHDTLALAPYFGNVLDRFATDEEIFLPVYARAFEDVTTGKMQKAWDVIQAEGKGTKLAVYEINFHTVRPGPVPVATRNDLVTSLAGSLALPLHQLLYMRSFPMGPMCSFTALEYSFEMVTGDHVRLWGLLRDLEGTGLRRPGWLGLQAVNDALLGSMLRTVHTGTEPGWHQEAFNDVASDMDVEYVHSFAFREGDDYSLVLFNLSLDLPILVELALPSPSLGGATLTEITAPSIHDDNEAREVIRPRTEVLSELRSGYRTVLPPSSLRVYRWTVVVQEPFRPVR